MAAAFKAALANVGNAVSGTTISLSTADIAVGDLVVVRWASDNLSATTPTVTASDGTANVYTVLRQGAVNATAAAGVAGGILVCKATVARPFASNLTLTFSGAVTAKAAYAESFTGALATVRSAAVGATGTATAASAGATGTVAAGDLVLGFIANETRAAITGDSDTTNGSWSTQVSKSNAASGSDAVCVTAAGQYKIATASGAQTYNVTAVAAEWVIGCVVLQAALVPNAGTAGGNFDNSVSATGKKNPTATAATTWAATLDATGAAPIPPPPGSRPLESGVLRATEDNGQRVLESFVVAPPNTGSVTTTYNEATTATGRKAPRGASTTTYTEVVAGAGKKFPKSTVVTAYAEAVTAAGRKAPTATVTTAYVEATTAAGRKAPKSTVTTSYIETVTASGVKPVVGIKQGTAAVTYTETVAAVGVAPVPPPESVYATRIKSLDPVSYWRLGETSGTVAVDATGHFDGEYTAAPILGVASLLTDDADTAMQVTGVTAQGVKAANRVEYQLFTDFTIEAWVKTSGAGSAFRSIVVKQNAYSMFTNDGVLVVYEWGSSAVINTGVNLNDGLRHHIVVAFGVNYGPSTSQIYLDGVAVGPPFMHAQLNQAAHLDIGYNDYAGQEFIGVIDEVAIYDRFLSAADVLGNYQVGTGGEPTVPANQGSATVTYAETLTAAGKRTAKSTATTTYTVAPAAAGKRTPKATVTTAHAWNTIAQGVKPVVGTKQGSGLVFYSETLTASGKRTPKGTVTLAYVEAVTGAGKRTPKGTKTIANVWALTSFGKRVPKGIQTITALWVPSSVGRKVPQGARTITNVWVVQANGMAPVLLVGYFTIGMQYGSQPVVAWEMNGQGAPV